MSYRINTDFKVNCGFEVGHKDVEESIYLTNNVLSSLPSSIYKSIDFKTTSSIVGAVFCESLASKLDAIVNPIEKGHPDIVPTSAAGATEPELRHYSSGLEIKTTIGNIETGSNLRAGEQRVERLTGLTWQAHHQEVTSLLGLTWDFATKEPSFVFPAITGAFYASDLNKNDWGAISGTSGRNTKVCGMKTSGKEKMGQGWIAVLKEATYLRAFIKHLKAPIEL